MQKLLIAAALALAPFAALTAAQPATSDPSSATDQMQEPHGDWQCAGSYSCYAAACRKARYLKDRGYCTCVKYYSSSKCYTVYYR